MVDPDELQSTQSRTSSCCPPTVPHFTSAPLAVAYANGGTGGKIYSVLMMLRETRKPAVETVNDVGSSFCD